MSSQRPIKVAISGIHEIYREGLKAMIHSYANSLINIVGDTATNQDLLNIVKATKPNLVVASICEPYFQGICLLKEMHQRYPGIRTIALSDSDSREIIYHILEAGVHGCILRSASHTDVLSAIYKVHGGEQYYCNSTSKQILQIAKIRNENFNAARQHLFTEKELQIIKMISREVTMKEIADLLQISIRTVEDYSKRIKEKIKAKSIVGIALFAVQHGIINIDDVCIQN